MLEVDIKKYREQLVFRLENAETLELHWETKAYSDCIAMLDMVMKKHGLLD
ncbi:MAG: hypothetical protein LBB36_06980 [Fibromonadaceae bacterium]|jgi:hypothetical protein|nr:hypothetical protein [Fibromonadaceae bacterium]